MQNEPYASNNKEPLSTIVNKRLGLDATPFDRIIQSITEM